MENYVIDWSAVGAIIAAIAAIVAAILSFFSAKVANKISQTNISASVELERIKFREKWIQNLREEMALCYSYSWKYHDLSFEKKVQAEHNLTKLMLLMNPNDSDYDPLLDALIAIQQEDESNSSEKNNAEKPSGSTGGFVEYTSLCQRILKREWDRLSNEIDNYLGNKNAKNK